MKTAITSTAIPIQKAFSFKVLAMVTTVIILIVDFIIPPETEIGTLYLIPLAMLFNQRKLTIYLFSFLLTVLILFDFFYSLTTTTAMSIYGGRIISIIVLWVVASILVRHKLLHDKTEAMKNRHMLAVDGMLFKTNHKVRHSVSQILGLAYHLNELPENLPEELAKPLRYIQQSAEELDGFTRELTEFIGNEKIGVE